MKKYCLLIAILIVQGGCVTSHVGDSPYVEHKPAVGTAKAPASEPPKTIYQYPQSTDDIVKIFNLLTSVKKDEFTTSKEHSIKIASVIEKISQDKDYYVFKAVEKKDVDGSYLPSLLYKADEKRASLVNDTASFSDYKSGLNYKTMHTIISRVNTREQTGANAFGVQNTYLMEQGTRYGVYFNNFGSISNSIETKSFSADDARRLKHNLSVFFIVSLESFGSIPMTIEHNDYSAPTINSRFAWDVNDKILVTELKAVLLCDKKRKEVVRTIYFDEN